MSEDKLELDLVPNWVDDWGNRYFAPPFPFYDGTAYCFDGENAGHWVEFGGPNVYPIGGEDD